MVLGDGPGCDPDEHGIRDPGGRAHRGRLHLLLHPLQDWRTNDAQLREQVDRTVAVRGVAQRIRQPSDRNLVNVTSLCDAFIFFKV